MTDEADKRAILDLQQAWTSAECAGEIDDLCRLMSEDVVIWPADAEPVCGIAAARRLLQAGASIIDISISGEQIAAGPVHAWKTARFTTRVDTGGKPDTIRGQHLWVMRRGKAGWKITGISWHIDR